MIKKSLALFLLMITTSLVIFSSAGAISSNYFSTTNTPDVIVPAVQGPSIVSNLKNRAKTAWPWYITRASGIVAAILLVILILSGIGLITGYSFKFLEPLNASATDRAMGLAFFVAVLVHGFSLLFDSYIRFNLIQVLFPFASNYRVTTILHHKVGSLYVALGIIAFYLILAIVLSSLYWIDKKPHRWKSLHFLAYLVMVFVFIHALYIGTDFARGIFRTLWILFGIIVAISIFYRLSRAKSI